MPAGTTSAPAGGRGSAIAWSVVNSKPAVISLAIFALFSVAAFIVVVSFHGCALLSDGQGKCVAGRDFLDAREVLDGYRHVAVGAETGGAGAELAAVVVPPRADLPALQHGQRVVLAPPRRTSPRRARARSWGCRSGTTAVGAVAQLPVHVVPPRLDPAAL